jgi:cell division septation protein DedD
MPPKQEEEFELVLGNRQLLSLFFLAVVLFAVFFSFGYMVGFGRGQHDRAAVIASTEPADEPQPETVRLPDALLEEAPRPPEPRAEVERVSTTAQAASTPPQPERRTPVVTELPKAAAKPQPVKPEPVKQTPPKQAPEKRPAATAAASGAAVARSIHLQVAAVRIKNDAQLMVDKLKSSGYRAALHDAGDGWFRIVVGPFNDEAAAKADQKRLSADGLDSLLRRK